MGSACEVGGNGGNGGCVAEAFGKVTGGLFMYVSGDDACCVETLDATGYGIIEWSWE